MRLRAAIELAILIIFLASTLVVIFWYSKAVPADEGGDAREYVRAGDRLYEAGAPKFSAAAVEYWEAARLNPNMADARFKIANLHYYNGWNQEALDGLDAVEKVDPNYPGLHLLRGKIYDRTEEIDEKFAALRQAVTAQPENPEAHYYLGIVYQQKGMTEAAIKEYKKAVELDSEPTAANNAAILKAHLHLGRIFKRGKDAEKAEEELRKALELDPTSAEVISELRILYGQQAESYKRQRQYDKAAEKYGEILKIDPKDLRNIGIYMELGARYEQEGLYDKAAEMYEAARELDPMNFDIYAALKHLEIFRNMVSQEE